jgi:hypothetical protein
MSAEFGMDYRTVMAMPLRTFWAYNRQINRIRAERDQRTLRLLVAAQANTVDTIKQLNETLRQEVEMPIVVEKQFDAAKFDELAKKFNKGA